MNWQGKHAKAGAVPAKQGAMVSLNIKDYRAGFYLLSIVHIYLEPGSSVSIMT
jgi:hypothetical protein